MPKNIRTNRPKNLNLFTIRLPINAVVSILHRVSGMILFVSLAFLLWVLQTALQSEKGYLAITHLFQHAVTKLFFIGLSWAFFHHLFAGLRHLGQDLHWMTSLQKARLSGRLVLFLVTISVTFFAWMIW